LAEKSAELPIQQQDTPVDKSHANMPIHMPDSSNTFNTSKIKKVNTAKPRKNKYPRKCYTYGDNEKENDKENDAQQSDIMYSLFSQNITKVDNGNVQTYICNMKSKSELEKVLRSINF